MAAQALTDNAEFKLLTSWAKACATARNDEELAAIHFLFAAWYLSGANKLHLAPDVADLLTPWGKLAPVISAPREEKMALSQSLRELLALHGEASIDEWVRLLIGLTPQTPSHDAPSQQGPSEHGSEWAVLVPWIRSAMLAHSTQEATLASLALGIVSAVQSNALSEHVDFAHLCQAHSDELLSWLEHSAQYRRGLEPVFTSDAALSVPQGEEIREAIKAVDSDEHVPSATWKWLHAAVTAANRYNRVLQVAYHEAGHAVALHVLSPETSFKTISIVASEDAAGHVSPERNDGYDSIYRFSLEHMQEDLVVRLAGRIAENKRFGAGRGDSGAVSDFASATRSVWLAVTAFGLDTVFGPVHLASIQALTGDAETLVAANPNGWLQNLAQQRVHAWLQWGMQETTRLIETHWAQVEAVAEALMLQKTLSDNEARRILGALRVNGEFALKVLR